MPNITSSILLLFFQSVAAGLLAVFTPFIYTILPFTVGYIGMGATSGRGKMIHSLYYAGSLILIFSALGILVSVAIAATGLQRFTEHWLFNLFFFRVFAVLGISFLGAFSIKLPSGLISSVASRARPGSFRGIFYMALTLPGASFSSTGPIIGLVLVLAGKASGIGPLIGLSGFGVGLALPFVFPGMLRIFSSSQSMLNNVKVVLGFFCLLLALKFLSNADVSLGLHLLGRDFFLIAWMLLAMLMGTYMMGKISLMHDYVPEENIHGQEYVPIIRLFIAIASFTFALYLLPGFWGAPLHFVSGFLPQ